MAESACSQDFASAVWHLENVYAGHPDKRARIGPARLAALTEKMGREAAAVTDALECDVLLERWLAAFEDGHVTLHSPRLRERRRQQGAVREKEPPAFFPVGTDASVLRLPSFSARFRPEVERILSGQRDALEARNLLVLDLRGNGGGADSTYAGLIPLLYTHPIREVGVDVLATPETAAAWERILGDLPADAIDTRLKVTELAARIRAAPAGTWLPTSKDELLRLERVEPRPSRVAIFVDRRCASSCEQFLLLARQSRKVVLFGTRTAGVLDYANVRPFPLPSAEERVLALATTRSRRLPAEPVDGFGIQPHVVLDDARVASLDPAAMVELASSYSGWSH